MDTAQISKDTTGVPVIVPFGEASPRHLHISVGACRLMIRPGEGKDWITGTYRGTVEALPLDISRQAGTVRIGQRQVWGDMIRLFEGVPTLELALGKAMPYSLTIETGASESYMDLGGLPLTGFELKQGAGKVIVDYSAPNPQEMDKFNISSGAGSIEARNLANANFTEMKTEGGVAGYKLDFGGTLRREMHAKISAAMSSVDLFIPSSTPAMVISQSMMGGLNVGDGYMKKEGAFWTEAALANLQPLLIVQVTLTMGSLNLHNG